MKWLVRFGWLSLGFLGLFVLLYAVGWFLPVKHRHEVEVRLDHSVPQVWSLISDMPATLHWRRGLDRIERMPDRDGKPLWRLEGEFGTFYYLVERSEPPSRYVNRVVDHRYFGGTWTFTLTPDPRGCLLRITEDGEIYNPIFRTMIWFFYGYGSSMENYLEDLDAVLNPEPSDGSQSESIDP